MHDLISRQRGKVAELALSYGGSVGHTSATSTGKTKKEERKDDDDKRDA